MCIMKHLGLMQSNNLSKTLQFTWRVILKLEYIMTVSMVQLKTYQRFVCAVMVYEHALFCSQPTVSQKVLLPDIDLNCNIRLKIYENTLKLLGYCCHTNTAQAKIIANKMVTAI